ncbi:MAG: cobalt chelatase [Ramlibacter sp.]
MDELCAATVRALTGEPGLHLRGRRLWRGGQPLPRFGPHLQPSLEAGDDFPSFRGAADGMALRLLHSVPELHLALVPGEPRERWTFELLEQLRVESLVPGMMPGMSRNLRHRFVQWSFAFHASGLVETQQGLLLFTVAQLCRSRVTGEPVAEGAQDVIEATRAALAPVLGPALAGLRRERFDQRAYAGHALAVARIVARSLREVESSDTKTTRAAPRFNLWFDFDPAPEEGLTLAGSGDSRTLADRGGGYRVFTTAYDTERSAAGLVRAALLSEYRERLDRAGTALGLNIGRLARELQAVLARPVPDGWNDGAEEGVLDARRLSQLVASPAERRVFRQDRWLQRSNCAITFLLDCSGSIRNQAESVALLVDVCARAFEAAGASCDVLGFTTGAWNGGRALRDWRRGGRPAYPGRLNERCHLVFKDSETPWSRGRRGIAALLKADLFREGIDGEAVDWTCARLLARDTARRLLFVVSDGSPMDSATALANDEHYLDQHLREVVARREVEGAVEIIGLGIGLDLAPYYRRSLALDLSKGLERSVFFDLVRVLSRPGSTLTLPLPLRASHPAGNTSDTGTAAPTAETAQTPSTAPS